MLKEFQTYRDLLNALLWISIALISVTPLFLSLQTQRIIQAKKKGINWPIFIAYLSFLLGLISMAYIYSWFMSPVQSTRIWTTVFVAAQLIIFTFATALYQPWWISKEMEAARMSKVIKLDGYYLDYQFRKVQIYVCEKTVAHHFDMPTDTSQRTDKEKKWAPALEAGNCPLC